MVKHSQMYNDELMMVKRKIKHTLNLWTDSGINNCIEQGSY
jgi:hypothetical protein